jgi:CTP:molybdopterin cytidylyltransferase MocA
MKRNPSASPRLCASALKPDHLAGLILAGGEGTRWGGPKAWAQLPGGGSFLDACEMTLREAGASPIVATLPPGTEVPRIDGLDVLALPEPGMDMFGSLRAGLDRLVEAPTWRVVAVLPVDHPLVRPETITELAAAAGPAAIPSFNGKHGHPICLARTVAESVARGDVAGPTLREVLRAVEALSVPVGDPGVIANCNTPEALSAALGAATPDP